MTEIFHTVNSGLYFRHGSHAVFFDGLHRGTEHGFSLTPAAVMEEAAKADGAFAADTMLFFTHMHMDHYDSSAVESFLALRPESRLIYPGNIRDKACPSPGEEVLCLRHGPFTLHAIPTTHQGGAIMQIEHYCCLLSLGDARYLICGDARLDDETVSTARRLAGGPITALFVNIYHLNSEREQRLVKALDARYCLLVHLPFPADDTNGIIGLSREAEALEGLGKIRLLRSMRPVEL